MFVGQLCVLIRGIFFFFFAPVECQHVFSVIVKYITLGLFNDACCHGNSLLPYSDWEEKKKGAAPGQ